MDFNRQSTTLLICALMVALVVGSVVVSNKDKIFKKKAAADVTAEESIDQTQITSGQIGSDLTAFMKDETFFNPEKQTYDEYLEKMGNQATLMISSVQKDLRIMIVDNLGHLIEGTAFTVRLNGQDEYTDTDMDGIIYIDHLRAGEYEVALEEEPGFRMPQASTVIQVKQTLEYAKIADIERLIHTEDEINAAIEDTSVNDAIGEATDSQITDFKKIGEGRIGIDVSKWNKDIDWEKVAGAGVEFAIIRAGYRGSTTGALVVDPYYEANIKGATEAGIPVGLYFFTQATNEVEAVEEASAVLSLCRLYHITYPIFIDTEGAGGSGRADNLDKTERTAVCKAFCQTIANGGYKAGVYASRNWLENNLFVNEISDYTIWLAEYNDRPKYGGYYSMWQYTSKGQIDGISTYVDLNQSYMSIDTFNNSNTTDHSQDE